MAVGKNQQLIGHVGVTQIVILLPAGDLLSTAKLRPLPFVVLCLLWSSIAFLYIPSRPSLAF